MTKGRRQQPQPQPQARSRSSVSECEGDDSFTFEANEAWKDFHGSLLGFYENGELCDVTLKVRPRRLLWGAMKNETFWTYIKNASATLISYARMTLMPIFL